MCLSKKTEFLLLFGVMRCFHKLFEEYGQGTDSTPVIRNLFDI